ncbi:MAG TPA: rod shape-determining protein MreC [Acidimicrobiales bacterium]
MALSTRRTGRSRFTLLLLVLTSVTVLTLDFRGQGSDVIEGARELANTAFAPIESAAHHVTEPVGDAWHGITEYDDVKRENDELRQLLAERDGETISDDAAREQLQELLAQENLPWVGDLPTVSARVVTGSPSNFEHTIEIDRGSDDGVQADMPVITGAGLIGRVVQAAPHRSVVLLVTDPSFKVGVRVAPSQETGLATGTGDGNPLVVDFGIPKDTHIREGDAVTTSGLGGELPSLFPQDLPVGRVSRISLAPDGLEQRLEVEPAADMDQVTFVKVLLWEAPE